VSVFCKLLRTGIVLVLLLTRWWTLVKDYVGYRVAYRH